MKKTYMKPELEAIKLNAHNSLLAGSLAREEGDAPISGGEYESLGKEDEFDW